jgi:hypothetical protein
MIQLDDLLLEVLVDGVQVDALEESQHKLNEIRDDEDGEVVGTHRHHELRGGKSHLRGKEEGRKKKRA